MQCTMPLVLKRADGRRHEVPCGRCVCCRIARAREWATRCLHESWLWPSSGFITLTYSDDHLPEYASLDKAEFTRFWKRLRKALDPDRIRYYGCGEYGELNGRPHYHAIVFGLRPCVCVDEQNVTEHCGCEDRDLVMDVWKHGAVGRIGTVTYDSARYVADYIGKALIGERAKEYGRREPPFQVMSKGLGREYIKVNESQLRDQLGVTVHGVQVGLPRYYSRKLEIDWKEVRSTFGVEEMKIMLEKARYQWVGGLPRHVASAVPGRRQREANANARLALFKKEGA